MARTYAMGFTCILARMQILGFNYLVTRTAPMGFSCFVAPSLFHYSTKLASSQAYTTGSHVQEQFGWRGTIPLDSASVYTPA